MPSKVIRGDINIAARIKQRRVELGLTIEEAASRAGVGMKTWSRYEAGESIRQDKVAGLCKALNWRSLTSHDENECEFSLEKCREQASWSKYLEKNFGLAAAMSFVIGSDILYDHIMMDMEELSIMPKGSHIGQLNFSCLTDMLPKQFLMHYDYDFLYHISCVLHSMCSCAQTGGQILPYSVMEELVMYLCNEEASVFMELNEEMSELCGKEDAYSKEWVFDLFGDMYIVTFLYSNYYLPKGHPYHFENWDERQFYTEN